MMDFSHLNTWLYGLFATILGGIVYLLRVIFTNQKQIELLEQKIELHEMYRKTRDARVDTQLMEIRTDVKSILKNG